MRASRTIVVMLLVLAPGLLARAAGPHGHAHEHGAARLNVALDGGRLTIELESPLDNLVGFEHAPKNARQRAALEKMETTLRAPQALFRPSGEAGCAPGTSEVEHPFGKGARHGGGDHADARARWSFDCAKPDALRSLEVLLFDAFRGMKRIRAQTATPRGQGGATLTPKRRGLAL